MTDEQKAKCHEIAEHYGEEHQMLKAVEEMAELTQQIAKRISMQYSVNAYAEELADAAIMLEQLEYLFAKVAYRSTMLDKYIDIKLNRQLERMERENDE
jgi:hypothetical protein